MSGVEPFILCAEFLNVDISKIAVMAALTVNLLSPCNVIPSCSSFPFLSQKASFRLLAFGLIQRNRQEEGRAGKPLSFMTGWDGDSGAALWCRTVVGGLGAGKCWEWRRSPVDRHFLPWSSASSDKKGIRVRLKEITMLVFTHSGSSLCPCNRRMRFPLLQNRPLAPGVGLCINLAMETRAVMATTSCVCVWRSALSFQRCVAFSLQVLA